MELELDFDALLLGDIDLIEETLSDQLGRVVSFQEVAQNLSGEGSTLPFGKVLRALALVQIRRDNPEATWEDTATVKVSLSDPTEAPGGES